MLVKLIHLFLSKARVTIVNVTEPSLKGWGAVAMAVSSIFITRSAITGLIGEPIAHPKIFFVIEDVVFEEVVIENKI